MFETRHVGEPSLSPLFSTTYKNILARIPPELRPFPAFPPPQTFPKFPHVSSCFPIGRLGQSHEFHTTSGEAGRSKAVRTLRPQAWHRRLRGLQVGGQERIQPHPPRERQTRDPRRYARSRRRASNAFPTGHPERRLEGRTRPPVRKAEGPRQQGIRGTVRPRRVLSPLDPTLSGTPRLRYPQGRKTPLPHRWIALRFNPRFGAPVGGRPAHHGPRFGLRLPLQFGSGPVPR